MDTGLAHRTAVVPGATAGLGLAVARALSAEGARVVLAGRRGELARELAAELSTQSGSESGSESDTESDTELGTESGTESGTATGVEADLTDPDGVRAVIDAAHGLGGDGVDVLVLNGGGPAPGTTADLDTSGVDDAIGRLLRPHVQLVSAFLPGMRERGWGRIVAIGSSGVQQPIPHLAASNVGRAALAGYLKTLAAEVAADGVTVNMVLPGRIDTDRVAALDGAAAERTGNPLEQVRRDTERAIPVGRYGRPDELAAVVTFLASDPAGYFTGEQLRCDGGMVGAY